MTLNVGILTFHHVENYGAVLQARALAQAVDSMGHSATVIDYRPAVARNQYRGLGLRSGNPLAAMRRRARLRGFRQTEMLVSAQCYLDHESLREGVRAYDAIITGSDQVWNVQSFRGFDPAFFLDLPVERRISYAPSCGHTTDFGSAADKVAKLVKSMHRVSTRDTHSAKLIEATCGREPQIVLDPCFLAEHESLLTQVQAPPEYVFVYLTQVNDDVRRALARMREMLGMPLLAVGARKHRGIGDEFRVDCGPREWLSLLRGASYVVTNSFHATVLSLMYERQLLVLEHSFGAMRMVDLLERFGQAHRVVNAANIEGVIERGERIDFSRVRDPIAEWTAHSRDFLMEALDD